MKKAEPRKVCGMPVQGYTDEYYIPKTKSNKGDIGYFRHRDAANSYMKMP
jgi:hypothetical protein